MKAIHVLTHAGTGTDVVQGVLSELGCKVHVVKTTDQARGLKMDRLILLGGSDIHPKYYGQKPVYARYCDRNRDQVEWVLVRRALANRVPIMGICRGRQMLAAAAGGALYQDISNQSGQSHGRMTHTIEAGALLRGWIPTMKVNSLHHQAVMTEPAGWSVEAVADDGVIEAIYTPGMLGVQFHPELMIGYEPGWVELFRWFVAGLGPVEGPLSPDDGEYEPAGYPDEWDHSEDEAGLGGLFGREWGVKWPNRI